MFYISQFLISVFLATCVRANSIIFDSLLPLSPFLVFIITKVYFKGRKTDISFKTLLVDL